MADLNNGNDIKKRLISGMVKTDTTITLKQIKEFVSPEQYEEIKNAFIKAINDDYEKASKDERNFSEKAKEEAKMFGSLEEWKEHDLQTFEENTLILSIDENGFLNIKELTLLDKRFTMSLDPETFDTAKFVETAKQTMQKVLDRGFYHDTDDLKKDEIPEELKECIRLAEEYKEKDEEVKEEAEEKPKLSRENAVEIRPLLLGTTLDKVVEGLIELREKGESVFVDFNDTKLYSCDVTMDGAYLEICGMTKEEFDKAREEDIRKYKEEEERRKKEAEEKKPEWLKRGKGLIYPEKYALWKECVDIRADDLYHGQDLEDALAIMQKLEEGASIEEVKKILEEQNQSGTSAGIVKSIVFEFSKRGPEFIEGTTDRELNEDEIEKIQRVKEDNVRLENNQKSNGTKGRLLLGLSKTQTWISLDEIKTFLPPEDYEAIKAAAEKEIEENYQNYAQEDKEAAEDYKKSKLEKLGSKSYTIGLGLNGKFRIQEFKLDDAFMKEFDEGNIDNDNFITAAKNAMQEHLDYGRFWGTGTLTGEEVQKELSDCIGIAEEYLDREEKEVTEEQKDDVPEERKEAEKEISENRQSKEETQAQIDEIERQIAELRAKEEELKKSLGEQGPDKGEKE